MLKTTITEPDMNELFKILKPLSPDEVADYKKLIDKANNTNLEPLFKFLFDYFSPEDVERAISNIIAHLLSICTRSEFQDGSNLENPIRPTDYEDSVFYLNTFREALIDMQTPAPKPFSVVLEYCPDRNRPTSADSVGTSAKKGSVTDSDKLGGMGFEENVSAKFQ